MTIEPRTIFIDAPAAGETTTHRLALYEWGDAVGAKGTVFCVHGLTRNGRDFDALASTLSADFHVYSLDVAGRGKSQWLNNHALYNYGQYISDIGHIANKLSLNNLHWIGTSMGGIIGMMVANNFPKLLKTLTLNDIGCLIPKEGLTRIAGYVGAATNFPNRALAEEELRCRCAPYGVPNEERWKNMFDHSIETNPDGSAKLAYDPAIAKNLTPPDKPIEDINLWPLWEAVKAIPAFLVRGKESDLLRHDTAMEMQKSHPNCKLLEIENVGHAPALMDELQIGAVRDFLLRNSL